MKYCRMQEIVFWNKFLSLIAGIEPFIFVHPSAGVTLMQFRPCKLETSVNC
jgi:hypothetical protein